MGKITGLFFTILRSFIYSYEIIDTHSLTMKPHLSYAGIDTCPPDFSSPICSNSCLAHAYMIRELPRRRSVGRN